MWKQTYSKTFEDLDKTTIWNLWTDIDGWPAWHKDLESCSLNGDFSVGNYFWLQPKGMKAFKIALTDIQPGESFTDCTSFLGAKMYDTHKVEETPEGLRLTNTLVVTGPLRWIWIKLVARDVADSVPEETEALVALARKKAP